MLSTALTKVLGLELHHKGDGEYHARWLELQRKGNDLEILRKKTLEGNLSKVLAALPKNLPLALVLSGKGILHKNVAVTTGFSDTATTFRLAFPAVEMKDFYTQQYHSEQNACISIARKVTIDELLAKLKPAGLQVYSLSLGGVLAVHILPQLNCYGEEITFDGHRFTLLNKELQTYSYSAEWKANFLTKLGEETIAEELLLAYAAAFQCLLHTEVAMVLADVEEVNRGFGNLLNKQEWQKKGMYFLFALFGLLLVSFAVFTHYNQENELLLKELGAQTSSAEQMELLQQQIVKQEQLLKQLNWNGGYNYGFLLNEVGNSMPRQLTLLNVAMNDFKTEQEKMERMPHIKIKGVTRHLTALNNWLFVLREKPWVKQAKLLKFQEAQEGDQYEFDLLINY